LSTPKARQGGRGGFVCDGDVIPLSAGNDPLARGALRAAAELDVGVPSSRSVVGFDGFDGNEGNDLGADSHLAPTTSGQPLRAMVARLQIEHMGAGSTPSRGPVPAAKLLARASTGPAA
jgi:DNA-binding LacI/PurR family transcriptional regulator